MTSQVPGLSPYLREQPYDHLSLSIQPPLNEHDGSNADSIASPISTLSNGTAKRKRGRPRKDVPKVPNGAPSKLLSKSQRAKSASVAPSPANGSAPPFTVTPETICSICGKLRNKSGSLEKMVSCVRCGRSGHPTCLGHKNPDVIKKMMSYDWCCIECKPCEVCLVQGDDVSTYQHCGGHGS